MADQALSAHTSRAYAADWSAFMTWCARRGFLALPARPETLALYLTELRDAGRSRATLQRRLAAIGHAHRRAGKPSPAGEALPRAIVAELPEAPSQAPLPLGIADLRALTQALPDTLAGRRDRALLLVGFGAALRRAELVNLDAEGLRFVADGLVLGLTGARRVGVPLWNDAALCPVRATREWLDAARIDRGPLFRSINRHGQLASTRLSDKAVALIVKRAASAAGYDALRFSGDSLRALRADRDADGVDWRQAPRLTDAA